MQCVSRGGRHRNKHYKILWNQKNRYIFRAPRPAVHLRQKHLFARIKLAQINFQERGLDHLGRCNRKARINPTSIIPSLVVCGLEIYQNSYMQINLKTLSSLDIKPAFVSP